MLVAVIMAGMTGIMVTIIGMAAFSDRAIGMTHSSIRQMGVIMIVLVDRKCRIHAITEHPPVFVA